MSEQIENGAFGEQVLARSDHSGWWSRLGSAEQRKALLARAVSLAALVAVLVAGAHLSSAAYYAITDAFVAPMILSPDSDMVLPSKLNLARLEAEHATLGRRVEQASSATRAIDAGARKLAELRAEIAGGLRWTESINTELVRVTELNLSALSEQSSLIRDRMAEAEAEVQELEGQLASGLVRKADVARERDALNQLRILVLQNERERIEAGSELRNRKLAQRALQARGKVTPMVTPEMLQQKDQLIRLDVDLLKLEGERRAQLSELGHSREELARLDELIAQVKARPVFRAIESRQTVAFVPYTQLESTKAGDAVYECRLWGVLLCDKVGRVTDVVPGEVAAPDPWGAVARGQYALLSLSDGHAARAKVLRVRSERESKDEISKRAGKRHGLAPTQRFARTVRGS